MNAQLAPVPDSPRSALKPRQVYLKGRIVGRRTFNTQEGKSYLTLIKLPAASEYDTPATVEVQSRESIGQKDDDWSGICEVRGYARSFDSVNREDGEKTRVVTATNILFVVG